MKNRIRLFAALCLLLFPALPGCAILDSGPPSSRVILPVRHDMAKNAEKMPASILVSQPVTDGVGNSDRILALMDGYEVRALDSARWASPVPRMVQRLVIDALESTRAFEGVGGEESLANATMRLQTEIRRFYLKYDSPDKPPVVELVFVFGLVDTATGKNFARTIVSVQQPCVDSSVREFVAAYSIGMTKVLEQCKTWVADRTREHLGKH